MADAAVAAIELREEQRLARLDRDLPEVEAALYFCATRVMHGSAGVVTLLYVIEPADFHREIYQLALTTKRAAIAAPREHAKSTVISLIFVWRSFYSMRIPQEGLKKKK